MDIGFDDMIQDSTLDYSSLNDSYLETSFDSDEISIGEESNIFSQISFGSHIDELYDPSIKTAQDSVIDHLEKAVHANTTDDLDFHLEEAKSAIHSADYWQQAKFEAEIDAAKDQNFIDSINRQLDTAEKYNRELEDIVFGRK